MNDGHYELFILLIGIVIGQLINPMLFELLGWLIRFITKPLWDLWYKYHPPKGTVVKGCFSELYKPGLQKQFYKEYAFTVPPNLNIPTMQELEALADMSDEEIDQLMDEE